MTNKIMATYQVSVQCPVCHIPMFLYEDDGSIGCVIRDCPENGRLYKSPIVELMPFPGKGKEISEKKIIDQFMGKLTTSELVGFARRYLALRSGNGDVECITRTWDGESRGEIYGDELDKKIDDFLKDEK